MLACAADTYADGMQTPVTFMVVDQNEDVCDRLGRSLDRLPDVRLVACTTNVMAAAEIAADLTPEVIIADFKWGQAKRSDILRWLARMSPRSAIVVYSSYYTDGEREAFLEAGAGRCLLKGMSVKQLAAEALKLLPATVPAG
jgi:DNA-binding NarL/FixJ family response regulator